LAQFPVKDPAAEAALLVVELTGATSEYPVAQVEVPVFKMQVCPVTPEILSKA